MVTLHGFDLKVELLHAGIKIDKDAGVQPDDKEEESESVAALDSDGDKRSRDAIQRKIRENTRRGGAGPAGGLFVMHRDGFQVNVPLQQQMTRRSELYMNLPPERGAFTVYRQEEGGQYTNHARLFRVPAPRFYKELYFEKENNEVGEGIPFKKIALIHGQDCVATTINQSCIHDCKFCAIDQSLEAGDTINKKTPDMIVAFIERARKEKRVKHVTLTSGTQSGDDGGLLEYVPVVKALKESFKYPVHVQAAPVSNLDLLDVLYDAGVDNIGIHLEAYPDRVRRIACPSKSALPLSMFEKNWGRAIDLFGPEQVESYLLAGLGETFNEYARAVDLMISREVIPFVVPARPIEGTGMEENQLESHLVLRDYYKYAGTSLHQQGLRPWRAVAGCVRCGACSAVGEATLLAQEFT